MRLHNLIHIVWINKALIPPQLCYLSQSVGPRKILNTFIKKGVETGEAEAIAKLLFQVPVFPELGSRPWRIILKGMFTSPKHLLWLISCNLFISWAICSNSAPSQDSKSNLQKPGKRLKASLHPLLWVRLAQTWIFQGMSLEHHKQWN